MTAHHYRYTTDTPYLKVHSYTTHQRRAEAIKALLKNFQSISREPIGSIYKIGTEGMNNRFMIRCLDSTLHKLSGDIVFIAIDLQ